jgi:hypothetical protein
MAANGDHHVKWIGEEENECVILKYNSYVYQESMTKCTINCWIIEEQGDRRSVNNRGG